MRAGAIAVEEAAQEVVALRLVRFEHLHLHAVGVADLGGRKASGHPATHPLAAQLAGVARPCGRLVLAGDGNMVEVYVSDGQRSAPLVRWVALSLRSE